ncbi:MAG TPA: divergent polysaccharide deacetylase family protein [Thermoanaerobaculia bacterium]|nr:divergent polysaccharide deacetylase family protein [Thermoanaerobaculia bacterium]
MTRQKTRTRGGLRGVLLVFFGVVLGVSTTLFVRGCARRDERPAPSGTRPTPSKGAPRATAPKAARPAPALPSDFEPADRRRGGVVAVVVDDVGYDERALETLARWDAPFAVAVIPSAPFASRAVSLAREKGWDLLVHLPMEPHSGPSEAEAIGGRDDDDAIRLRVLRALAKTPGAIGINNHQGSKATADTRVVRDVLGVVRDKGLFFLDSRTTNASVAGTEAAAMGVPFLSRDVFLDDVAAETSAKGGVPEALDAAWERALALATKKGQAIVIGHPRKETLAFLSEKIGLLGKKEGPRAVKVSELVP